MVPVIAIGSSDLSLSRAEKSDQTQEESGRLNVLTHLRICLIRLFVLTTSRLSGSVKVIGKRIALRTPFKKLSLLHQTLEHFNFDVRQVLLVTITILINFSIVDLSFLPEFDRDSLLFGSQQ